MRLAPTIALATLLLPATATASGSLTISLLDSRSRPVEGTVTARPRAGGAGRSCTTRAGSCIIRNLGAGQYRVTATTVRGAATSPVVATVQEGRAARARLSVSDVPAAGATTVVGVVAHTPDGGSQGATHQGPGRPGASGLGRHGAPAPVSPGLRPEVPRVSPAPVAASSGPTKLRASAMNTARDLGRGEHRVIRGSAQDQRSRPVEGTVTVSKDGVVIGTVQTSAGSFQVYDLEPGRYRLGFTSISGLSTNREVTVESGPATSVRLTIQR